MLLDKFDSFNFFIGQKIVSSFYGAFPHRKKLLQYLVSVFNFFDIYIHILSDKDKAVTRTSPEDFRRAKKIGKCPSGIVMW